MERITHSDYLHYDHLGSVIALSDASGNVTERLSYDPWGKRRPGSGPDVWQAMSPGSWLMVTTLARNPRGFTGHEHLENARYPDGALGLIHMNGRVYDPEIGMFLSADPFIQFPHSTQGLNRYAYVGNNPLSYADPSGHFIFGLAALALIVKVETIHWAVAMTLAAVAGYLDTGSLKAGLFSGLSAGLASGVGGVMKALELGGWSEVFLRGALHGLAQGAVSSLQGGRFGAGALAGFAGSVLGPVPEGKMDLTGNKWGRVIQAAVAGGTAGRIGGGKFANGAMTGAFVQVLNHEQQVRGPEDASPDLSITDVRGTQETDTLAIEVLNSYPQKQPYELRTEFARANDGLLMARDPTRLGPFGGAGNIDMTGVEAIAHTHPYFTAAQAKELGINANATNRVNRWRGPGDHIVVEKFGVPNYFRTPAGDAIKVVERVNGKIQTRTVWER